MENQKLSFAQLSDTQRQDLAERFINKHPVRLNNSIVEYILTKSWEDNSAPFSWDDVTNYDYYGTVEINGYWEEFTEEERDQQLEKYKEKLEDLEREQCTLEELIDLCEFEEGELQADFDENPCNATQQSINFWVSEAYIANTKLHKVEDDIEKLEEIIDSLDYMDFDQQPEIFQWFSCDDRLIYQLNKRGQCTVDGEFWGRQSCGQSITLDHVIQEIAFDYFCEYGEDKINQSHLR